MHKTKETLCAAVQVTVVGQVLPVLTSIRLQLTTTRISFQPSQLHFGDCNLAEKTGVSVVVTNHSLLPQKYGKVVTCVWLADQSMMQSIPQSVSLSNSHLVQKAQLEFFPA